MKHILLALALSHGLAAAEVVVYTYSGRHRLIQHGLEFNVPHTGYLVLDFDSGQGYRVDTFRGGPSRYVRVNAVNDLEYYKGIGFKNYTLLRSGTEIGLGVETTLDLGPVIAGPMPRTFQMQGTLLDDVDQADAIYSNSTTTFTFSKSVTHRANLNLFSALVTTMGIHQSFLDRHYLDLTPSAAAPTP